MEYKFNIILERENHLKAFLKSYNDKNNTSFELDDVVYDEVIFARLKTNKDSAKDILQLGIEYGREITLLRIN
jgi:hypothetical protein